jgi:hypothetical protein
MQGKVLLRTVVCLLALGLPAAAQIRGDYMEARTADVYTGPCFANGEVGLTGHEAVLAWRIESGTWGNMKLDGLSVVAVVRANATLGDPYVRGLKAKAVMIVDSNATPAQQAALVNFAQAQTGGLLDDVLAIESAPIRFIAEAEGQHGFAILEAGNLARIRTRMLTSGDKICHNEEVYYSPLAGSLTHAMPVVAEAAYKGNHLGLTWNDYGRRGAFVGTFEK